MKLDGNKMKCLNELVQLGWTIKYSSVLLLLYPPKNCGFVGRSVISLVSKETGLYLVGYDFDGDFCFKFCNK